MFKITDGKGFQMTFANGWTVSVQFGFGNYADNQYDSSKIYFGKNYVGLIESETAEVAIWDREGKWYDFGSDKVKGYLNVDEVAEFINMVRCL